MSNTLFTLDVVKSRNAELIKAAKRYRLAKKALCRSRGETPQKAHSVRQSTPRNETTMT